MDANDRVYLRGRIGPDATSEAYFPTGDTVVRDSASNTFLMRLDWTPEVAFYDSFEGELGQWAPTDWFASTQRATEGSSSAEVDGNADDATLSVANPIDMSGFASAELTFSWFIENSFDNGEFVALDFSADGGNSWTNNIRRIDGNSPEEGVWHHERVELGPAFLVQDFEFRYRYKVNRSNEDANLDNVQLLGTSLAQPSFSISDVSVNEGDSGTTQAQLTVTRSGDTSGAASVDYATNDGSATTADGDYVQIPTTTLNFAAGESEATIVVTVNGDTNDESDEAFTVELSNPSGAAIADGAGTVTIQDDDGVQNDPNTLYVSDIYFQSRKGGKDRRVVVEIRSDSNADGQASPGDEVRAGVQVTVNFNGVNYTGTTDGNGIFRTNWISNLASGSYYANVVDLVLTGYGWDPLDLDSEDDSDGDGKPDDLLV